MLCLTVASAQVKLAFDPKAGAKYEYQMETVQNIKQTVMEENMTMSTETSTTYLMEVKEKTPQEIQVQFTYQRFVFVSLNPMMNVRYDSKVPNKNASDIDGIFEKMFSTLINKPFTVIFAPDGSVKSVSGMSAIAENMLKEVSFGEEIAAQIGIQISQLFSDEFMKNMFEQSFNFYPKNAVKVGESWNTEYVLPMGNIKFDFKSKNTLKEVKANKATIEVTGDMNMNMAESKFTGTQTGTMIVDAATGMIVTSDVSQNMKGSINMQGMDFLMDLTSKTKTSVKEVK
jgi:Cu/Ag efflux pump CusA